MIILPVEGGFEELPARPRQPVGSGSGVIAVARERGVFKRQARFVSFGALLVPSKVKDLLRRIVQVSGEFFLPISHGHGLSMLRHPRLNEAFPQSLRRHGTSMRRTINFRVEKKCVKQALTKRK